MMRPVRIKGLKPCLRGTLLFAGLFGVFWSAITLPSSWSAGLVMDLATRILANDRFKPSLLDDVTTAIKVSPKPFLERASLIRAKTLVQLRIAEDAMMQNDNPERTEGEARETLISSLSYSASDPFLWLMLYSFETNRGGFDVRSVRFLQRSYEVGPREGWISLRRNRIALAIFPVLDTAMQDQVSTEFAAIVDANFIQVAARLLSDGALAYGDHLFPALETADLLARERLAIRLRTDGIKAEIPGVYLDDRLWR